MTAPLREVLVGDVYHDGDRLFPHEWRVTSVDRDTNTAVMRWTGLFTGHTARVFGVDALRAKHLVRRKRRWFR